MFKSTYKGPGPIEEYESLVTENAPQIGLSVQHIERSEHTIVIRLVQSRPWYKVLLFALPQRMRWELCQTGQQVTFTYQTRAFGWYAVILVLLSLAWPTMLLLFLSPDVGLASGRWTFGWCLLCAFAVVLILVPPYLIDAYGGRRIGSWLNLFHRCARLHGGTLERISGAMRAPSMARLSLYAIYLLVAMGWITVIRDWDGVVDMLAKLPVMWMIIGTVSALICAVAMMCVSPPAMLRSGAVVSGLHVVLAEISILLMPMFWLIGGIVPELRARVLGIGATGVEAVPQAERVLTQQCVEMGHHAIMFFPLVLISALAGPLLALWGVLHFCHAMQTAAVAGPGLWRMRHAVRGRETGEAVSGKGFLKPFRLTFGAVWFFLGGFMLVCMVIDTWCMITASVGEWFVTDLYVAWPVKVSMCAVSHVVSGTCNSAVTGCCMRIGWTVFGACALTPLALSLGELVRQRRAVRRRLRASQAIDSAETSELRGIVMEMAGSLGLAFPVLVINDAKEINAYAHQFGVLWPSRYIEVTSGAVSALGPSSPMMRALLAHELAHLRLRHLLVLGILRWLGRLTLVGDGLAFAFAHSFDYEHAADLAAVRRFGVPKEAMVACLTVLELQTLRLSGTMGRQPPRVLAETGSATEDVTREYSHEGAFRLGETPWRAKWKAFIRVYTRPFECAYWHPAIRQRIAALAGI